MVLGACPVMLEPATIAPEVDARVLLLESQTGMSLPPDKCELLSQHTLESVNQFFFENALREEHVTGWKTFRIQLKSRPQVPSPYEINMTHEHLRSRIEYMRTSQLSYFSLLKRARQAHGKDTAFELVNLQPAINAGYTIKEVDNSKLVLATPPIIITFGGNRFQMGRYKVIVYQGYIRVVQYSKGLGVTASGYRHPHITPAEGEVCWGTAHGAYINFVESGDPNEALLALLAVLRNYNPESPYRGIGYWAPTIMGIVMPEQLARGVPWKEHCIEDESDTWANIDDDPDDDEYESQFYVYEYRDRDNLDRTLGQWGFKYEHIDGEYKLTLEPYDQTARNLVNPPVVVPAPVSMANAIIDEMTEEDIQLLDQLAAPPVESDTIQY